MSGKGSSAAAGAGAGTGASKAPSPGTGKAAVFAYGRFQPPHAGHGVIVAEVARIVGELKATGKEADGFIFATSTYNANTKPTAAKPRRNPLKVEEKVAYLQKMFPLEGIQFVNTTEWGTPQLPQVIEKLQSAGYTHLYLAVGSDRVEDFAKFAGLGVTVVGAGEERREHNKANLSLAGLSATKMRNAAVNGNLKTFATGTLIGEMTENNVKNLMGLVAKRMTQKASKGGARSSRKKTRKEGSKN